MKRLLNMIGALALLMIAMFTMNSCDRNRSAEQVIPTADSTCVATYTLSANVSFESVQDVLTFQNDLSECYGYEEAFLALQPNVVKSVSTVLLDKNKTFTIKDIIIEYRANKNIYDSLNPTTDSYNAAVDTSNKEPYSAMEGQLPTIEPNSVSYRYEIDTVDGKPTKVLVKEERYDSK